MHWVQRRAWHWWATCFRQLPPMPILAGKQLRARPVTNRSISPGGEPIRCRDPGVGTVLSARTGERLPTPGIRTGLCSHCLGRGPADQPRARCVRGWSRRRNSSSHGGCGPLRKRPGQSVRLGSAQLTSNGASERIILTLWSPGQRSLIQLPQAEARTLASLLCSIKGERCGWE